MRHHWPSSISLLLAKGQLASLLTYWTIVKTHILETWQVNQKLFLFTCWSKVILPIVKLWAGIYQINPFIWFIHRIFHSYHQDFLHLLYLNWQNLWDLVNYYQLIEFTQTKDRMICEANPANNYTSFFKSNVALIA